MRRLLILAGGVYLLLAVALVQGLWRAREGVQRVYGTDQARQDWQAWRDEVAHEANQQPPVARRIPKSTLPPAYVLLQHHFGVCLGLSLILVSALYWTLVLMLLGVALSAPIRHQEVAPSDARPSDRSLTR